MGQGANVAQFIKIAFWALFVCEKDNYDMSTNKEEVGWFEDNDSKHFLNYITKTLTIK